MDRVDLAEFAGGALQEQFDDAMEKVLVNLTDVNTPWKNKRKIVVEVSFEQNEDRDDVAVSVSTVPKLAPVKPVGTRMAIGKDLRTGEVYAEEYGSQCRGQMLIDDYLGPEVDAETGEIKEDAKVVDFRKQA